MGILPFVCPTVWCRMSFLLSLVCVEMVRFFVFVDTKLLLSGLYPFPLWTLMWFIRMFCGDSPCYLCCLLADCTITYDVYSTPIWGTGAILHALPGQLVLPFSPKLPASHGAVGCLLLDCSYDSLVRLWVSLGTLLTNLCCQLVQNWSMTSLLNGQVQ